jgi:hypothetical protein
MFVWINMFLVLIKMCAFTKKTEIETDQFLLINYIE